jgi:hypothetical protein
MTIDAEKQNFKKNGNPFSFPYIITYPYPRPSTTSVFVKIVLSSKWTGVSLDISKGLSVQLQRDITW